MLLWQLKDSCDSSKNFDLKQILIWNTADPLRRKIKLSSLKVKAPRVVFPE